jgi:hypothetical protein
MTPRHEDFNWPTVERLRELAADETLWQYYLETMVRIETADLTGIVRPTANATGAKRPPLGPLHVITAVQPDSDPASADNSARMILLDNELRLARLHFSPAVGSSFDGTHSEVSRAVFGLDDTAARRLGERFGQVAVFGWRGPVWSLQACVTNDRRDRPWHWVS